MTKKLLPLLLLALLSLPNFCAAFESIEFVTKERAKELGLVIKTNGAGPDAIYIELSFDKQGEMKSYSRVALEMHAEGKLLMTSTLREENSDPGKVVVGFAAASDKLDTITLKIVTQSGGERTGHVLKMHEFVEVRKPKL